MSSLSSFVIQTPTLQKESLLLEPEEDDGRLTDALKARIEAFSPFKKRAGGRLPQRRAVRKVQEAADPASGRHRSVLVTLQKACEANQQFDSLYALLQYIKATITTTFAKEKDDDEAEKEKEKDKEKDSDNDEEEEEDDDEEEGTTIFPRIQFVQIDNDNNTANSDPSTGSSPPPKTITIRHAGIGTIVKIQYTTKPAAAAAAAVIAACTGSNTDGDNKDDKDKMDIDKDEGKDDNNMDIDKGDNESGATTDVTTTSTTLDTAELPITIVSVSGEEGEYPPPSSQNPNSSPQTNNTPTPFKGKQNRYLNKKRKANMSDSHDEENVNDSEDEEMKQEDPASTTTTRTSSSGSGRRSIDELQKQWDTKWYTMLEKVKEFRKEKGHANVPKDYIPDRSLGSWVSSQRTARKEGRLKEERIEALNEVGFVWSFRTIGKPEDMKLVSVVDGGDTAENAGDVAVDSAAADAATTATNVDWNEPAVERKWKAMLERLKAFAAQNGHTRVPSGYKIDPQLSYWVQNQRVLYRKNKLPQERIRLLEEIGFLWRVYPSSSSQHQQSQDGNDATGGGNSKTEQQSDEKFKEMVERLKSYKSEHGNTVVPQRYEKDLELGKWVQNQRRNHADGKMRPDRKTELDSLEFVWKVGTLGDRTWQDNFERLLAFKEKWGDCLVPTKYEPDQRLASWVMWQRGKYHQNKLPDEYIAKLDAIGFVWKVQRKGRRINHMSDVRGGYKNSTGFIIWSPSTSNEFWEAQLEKLIAYKAKFGHTNVPVVYFEDLQLAKWVTAQRMMYTKGSLTQERIDKLEAIGFVWRLVRSWDDNFDRLKKFHEKHGHCNVPIDDAEDPKLGRWVKTQRAFSKRKELTVERLEKLQSLGFEWNPPKGSTGVGIASAPARYPKLTPPSGVELPAEKTARLKATNARLSQDRKDLEAENRELRRKLRVAEETNSWEEGFNLLQDYVAEHGDAHAPIAGSKLGQWVAKMRDQYKRQVLSQERITKLEGIGFEWTRKPGPRPLGTKDDDESNALESSSPPNKKQRTETTIEAAAAPAAAVATTTTTNAEILAEEEKLKQEEDKLAEAKRRLEEEKEKLRLRRESLQTTWV